MTDGYTVTLQNSRVATGEPDCIFVPRSPRSGKRGVILCHGGNNPLAFVNSASTASPSSVRLAAYLAANGVACIAGQFGSQTNGNNYANDEAMSRITAAWTALKSACSWLATDKMCLYGISMGAGTAARYAMLNPSSVAAVYGTAPMSDITDIYTNNRGSAQAGIGTAWGVTYPTALPSGADLPGQAHLASAVPCQLDYGTADTIIISSTVTALATAWGANCTATVIDTTNDHGDALFAKTSPQSVFSLFTANGS